MKKTDKTKYLALAVSFTSLGLFAAGFQTAAAFISVPAIFMIGFTPNKSGILFTITAFFTMLTCGFLIDFPFHKFPVSLLILPMPILTLHIRTWAFTQMAIYKLPKLELVLLIFWFVVFIPAAFLADYTWQQWVCGGIPMLLYFMFAFIVNKDRNEATMAVENMKVKLGNTAPDFNLPDQNGNDVSLKNILSKSHALIIFVRGDWCPTCHMMLRGYMINKDKFAQKNVKVIGIGPDPVGVNKDMMSRIDEQSLMLADVTQDTASNFSGALQENNPVTKNIYKNGIPLPASFLVHQNGNIIYASRSDKAAEILQPDKIFEVLDSL